MSGQATIAERYARAIFALGVESGTLAALAEQGRSFAGAYQSSLDLRSVLENPLVPLEQRQKILTEVAARLGLGPSALNTVRYLAQRRRLSEQLATLVGRKVVLDRREDPALLAGVVTRIGDNTIDGSIRGRLDQLER